MAVAKEISIGRCISPGQQLYNGKQQESKQHLLGQLVFTSGPTGEFGRSYFKTLQQKTQLATGRCHYLEINGKSWTPADHSDKMFPTSQWQLCLKTEKTAINCNS